MALIQKTGKFARVTPYLQHLRNPNNVAFYTDSSNQTWLYLALTDKLERFRFHAGEKSPSSTPEVLATYPDYGLNYKYGGWHLTRTIAFGEGENKDKLYVTVGSSCNECEEKEEIRATVSVMDPDGKNAEIIGRGLRNAVGLRWVNNTLYGTNMGADHLGDDAPDDTMFALSDTTQRDKVSRNYGWPYCYFKDTKCSTIQLSIFLLRRSIVLQFHLHSQLSPLTAPRLAWNISAATQRIRRCGITS